MRVTCGSAFTQNTLNSGGDLHPGAFDTHPVHLRHHCRHVLLGERSPVLRIRRSQRPRFNATHQSIIRLSTYGTVWKTNAVHSTSSLFNLNVTNAMIGFKTIAVDEHSNTPISGNAGNAHLVSNIDTHQLEHGAGQQFVGL